MERKTIGKKIKRINYRDGGCKYICPDCGRKHNEEHHPPYCGDCIRAVTGV